MTVSVMAVPIFVIRSASHCGTSPPCKGRSAVPDFFTIPRYLIRCDDRANFQQLSEGPRKVPNERSRQTHENTAARSVVLLCPDMQHRLGAIHSANRRYR